jgi:hypothetical protein
MWKILFLNIFLSNWGLTPPPSYHKFHISKCLVEFNEQEQALQFSMHIFLDDLEEALRRKGADDLFICTKMETENAEAIMAEYITKNFVLELNGEAVAYNFLGKEPSEDLLGVWCYMEISGIQNVKNLKITNNILLEVYDDQKNVVSIIGPERRKGMMLLQRGQSTEQVTF